MFLRSTAISAAIALMLTTSLTAYAADVATSGITSAKNEKNSS
ncbi:MAG: hypothetical protein ABL857_04495 [Rickettsiales bacterium]